MTGCAGGLWLEGGGILGFSGVLVLGIGDALVSHLHRKEGFWADSLTGLHRRQAYWSTPLACRFIKDVRRVSSVLHLRVRERGLPPGDRLGRRLFRAYLVPYDIDKHRLILLPQPGLEVCSRDPAVCIVRSALEPKRQPHDSHLSLFNARSTASSIIIYTTSHVLPRLRNLCQTLIRPDRGSPVLLYHTPRALPLTRPPGRRTPGLNQHSLSYK